MSLKTCKILSLVMTLMLALWATGCSSHDDVFPSDPGQQPYDGDLYLVLRVSVLGAGGGSRHAAASRADGDNEPDYSFELPTLDTEKLQFLRVIIVKVSENGDKTIVHNYPMPLSQPTNTISDLRFEVDFSTHYNIYLIGNEGGLPESVKNLLTSSKYDVNQTYPADGDALENIILSTPDPEQPDALIDNSGTSITLIPMTEKFEITTVPRPEQGPQDRVVTDYRNLFLTRTASKFTFNFFKGADHNPNYDNSLKVKAVKIYGISSRTYLFPRADYSPAKDEQSTNPYDGRIITSFKEPDENVIGEYTFSLPDLGDIKNFPVSYSPALYFAESNGYEENPNPFACSISFDGEEFMTPVFLPNLPSLPRNSHVIINITIHETNMTLTAVIVNWVPEDLTLDYTAIPSVRQRLQWEKNSYESYDPNTGVVIVKPASTVESIVPVKGSFILETPAGATWHAFLIPSTGNGNPYAFQFKDKDNNYVSSLSGIVVPNDTIYTEIYPRIVEPAENNEVFLQIVVTLGNGSVIEVPVTPDGKSYKNFTILQNKQ